MSQSASPSSSNIDHYKEIAPANDNENDTTEDETYLHGVKLALVVLAIYLSVFCVALDNTIIATAVPRISDQFHAVEDVGWYGSAYLLCEAAFQLLFGKLYTNFNMKPVYLGAMVLFEIGSAVSASAPESAVFILGRAISGVGSAGIFCGATLIIARSVAPVQRPMYLGAFGAMYGLASAAGPLLGGVLTTQVSWRWCFYINIPVGVVTIGLVAVVYRSKAPERMDGDARDWKAKLAGLDFVGTAVFLPAVISLLLALQWGGTTYAWDSWRIMLTLTFAAVLAIAFGITQWIKQDKGTLPPKLLANRSVAAAAWFGSCIVGSLFSMVYYVPIWFQAIEGVDPMESGIRNIALVLSLVLASLTAGVVISSVVGYYNPFMICSSILASVGAGMLYLLQTHSGPGAWIGYQILFGTGIGLGMQQALTVVSTVLSDDSIPMAVALVNFSQTLGGSISISVASSIFNNRLVSELRRAAPQLNIPRLVAAGATKIRDLVPPKVLPDVLRAYNTALVHTFTVPMALAALSLLGALSLEWKSVKKVQKIND